MPGIITHYAKEINDEISKPFADGGIDLCALFDNQLSMTTDERIKELRVALGQRLNAARKRLKIYQSEIADALGCSIPQVSRWETGDNEIPSSRIADMARAYRVSAAYIFGESELDAPAIELDEQVGELLVVYLAEQLGLAASAVPEEQRRELAQDIRAFLEISRDPVYRGRIEALRMALDLLAAKKPKKGNGGA